MRAAFWLGMEYLADLEPQDEAQRVFNTVAAYSQTLRETSAPAWVILLAMAYAWSDERMPEPWAIAAEGHLPVSETAFAKLVAKARRAIIRAPIH